MPRTGRLILLIACVASVALGALLLLQSAGVVPPAGIGWGDGARARAYSIQCEGSIVFRTASGMTPAPPGNYVYVVQSRARWNRAGISYHRWSMTAGRAAQAPVLGQFAEVRVAPAWPLLISLAFASLWVKLVVGRRRARREGRRCIQCGYDLRATPHRCPECGSVPAVHPAA